MYRSLSADNPLENDVDYSMGGEVKGGVSKEKNELRVAQQKIKLLEQRLEELEKRLPKKYGEVKFLNYQTRKRIMVRASALLVLTEYQLNN